MASMGRESFGRRFGASEVAFEIGPVIKLSPSFEGEAIPLLSGQCAFQGVE